MIAWTCNLTHDPDVLALYLVSNLLSFVFDLEISQLRIQHQTIQAYVQDYSDCWCFRQPHSVAFVMD